MVASFDSFKVCFTLSHQFSPTLPSFGENKKYRKWKNLFTGVREKMGVLFRHIGKIQGGDFENRRLVGNVEVSKQNFTMSKNTDYSGHPILGQLLSFIPKEVFKGCVVEEKSDKWYKQVKTWDHFVFMAYGVLTGSSSLREIIKNFTLFGSNLRHCGIFLIPRRSSISDANSRRNSSVFRSVVHPSVCALPTIFVGRIAEATAI